MWRYYNSPIRSFFFYFMKSIFVLRQLPAIQRNLANLLKSMPPQRDVFYLSTRPHSYDVPRTTKNEQRSQSSSSSVLDAVLAADAPEHVALTRSQLAEELAHQQIHYRKVTYGNFLQVDCAFCGEEYSCYISGLDNTATCVACHVSDTFEVYLKCAVTNKLEATAESEARVKERIEKEEQLRLMESPEELDSDLYDRVSYLNLMNQLKDRDNAKKDNQRRVRDDSDAPSPRVLDQSGMMQSAQPDPHIKYLWNESVDISEMAGIEQNDMLQLRMMLGIERISTETLSRYNVRGHMDGYDQPAVLYPRYRGLASRIRIPVGLKVIRKVGDRMEKENYPLPDETLPKPRFYGMFGYHMTTASDRAVVLTTNERDTLAVYEATDGALAFALPHGERLDSTVFPYLEDFEQIFLWFPPRHLEFAKEWGYALNGSRCYLIRNEERPIELVRNGKHKEVKHILSREAVRLREKGFRSMTDVREEVKADLINSSTRQLGLAQWKTLRTVE
ncbi:hypothetical protein KIN20_011017 [Parelaphostrongylus tenuis]|uniref:Uncharacterized protein n=1 Tax=Parelaphostrongylus tenuis TaxID=148309 RepID=A0AAD5QM69_PARTN|nr:hypothetical protein KIN20_011017 [Parelaphostrongylus tenuis]